MSWRRTAAANTPYSAKMTKFMADEHRAECEHRWRRRCARPRLQETVWQTSLGARRLRRGRTPPMAQPVVHFEIIGKDPMRLRSYYGDLFGWDFITPSPVAEEVSEPDSYGF